MAAPPGSGSAWGTAKWLGSWGGPLGGSGTAAPSAHAAAKALLVSAAPGRLVKAWPWSVERHEDRICGRTNPEGFADHGPEARVSAEAECAQWRVGGGESCATV